MTSVMSTMTMDSTTMQTPIPPANATQFIPPKITVKDFNFFYGEAHVLHGIDLEIPEQQVTALIGPSGCGKSTFLRSINRMNDIIPEAHGEGTIEIDGKDIYAPRDRRRRAAAPRRDGLPEVESVPEVDLRQRRVRPAHRRHAQASGS